MIIADNSYDEHWRQMTFSPEESAERYKNAAAFLENFYQEKFSLDTYMPVIKDGYESKINMLQFIINYLASFPQIPQTERALVVAWVTQAAFWMGYLEGKSQDTFDLPKGFFDTLKELD